MSIFLKLWEEYPGKILGVLIGLLVGFIFLFVGFWKTLVFVGFVAIGLYIGHKLDSRENLHDVLEEILPDKFFK
ncbi:DUF2273 domain-containing protein [Tepidibacillus marianensis]|uniref:DUF2273 domain-containing protein n=1 Tax=Tepidibacillus marianensis TaxID=3131995 RepID=UPI0030D0D1E9